LCSNDIWKDENSWFTEIEQTRLSEFNYSFEIKYSAPTRKYLHFFVTYKNDKFYEFEHLLSINVDPTKIYKEKIYDDFPTGNFAIIVYKSNEFIDSTSSDSFSSDNKSYFSDRDGFIEVAYIPCRK
jgi:hypothetical protein